MVKEDEEINIPWGSITIGIGIVMIIAVIVISLLTSGFPIRIVPTGYVGIYQEWGSAKNMVGEGIHFVIPFMGNIDNVNTQIQKYEASAESASRDLQVVDTNVTLNYRVPPDKAYDIYRSMRNEYESRVIVPVIQEAVKASTAKYTAEELIEKRPLVKEEISSYLKSRLEESYGLEVTDVSITNFQFSQNFDTAIEQKMVAQQDALKANYTLQQKTVEAQTRIVEANASAEAAILAAKGQATSTIIVAQATAEAIQLKTNNLSDLYVRLLYVERWNGQLPQVLGQAGIFVPLATQENESSQIGS